MPNAPFRAIVCPVDFSPCSAGSLEAGAQLARLGGVPLKVLHAAHFEAPPYFTEAALTELAKQLANARQDARAALASWCEPHLPAGLDVSYEILELPAVDAIRRVAESLPGCWIVMGTHGRTGLQRLLLGSVTERTLREAGVPVLTIPPAAK